MIFVVMTATTVAVLLPLIGKKRSVPSIVKSFSLDHSWAEVCGLDAYKKKPKISTLYGLRFFLISWIITVHTITIVNYQFFRKCEVEER